ncbi:NADP-dependent oxidoreductase [Microbacterium lacusdiani]
MRFRPPRSAARTTTARAPRGALAETVEAPPEHMRAVLFDGPGDPSALRVDTIPVPSPVMDEVLVRVVAAGVNPIDAKTRAGGGVTAGIASYPVVPGFDLSGVVVASPFEAHPLPPGTPVFGMAAVPRTAGAYAEYAVVPSTSLARKPSSLSHVEAAGVPLAALTAWQLIVETAHAHEGQRILIHAGAGGVGHFAVQFASYFGAHVTATASAANASWLRELGAHVVIDHTTTRFEEVATDVDVVIALLGDESTVTRSLQVLRPGGLLVVVPSSGWPGYAEAAADAGVRATRFKVVPDGVALSTIGRLLDSGAIQVYIEDVFDLEDAADAHRHLETGRTRGKLVLQVSDG